MSEASNNKIKGMRRITKKIIKCIKNTQSITRMFKAY